MGDSGAAYIFKRDLSNLWSQLSYIKASNTEAGDMFGWNVNLDNDKSIISSYNEASYSSGINGDQADNSSEGSGAVFLFE